MCPSLFVVADISRDREVKLEQEKGAITTMSTKQKQD